MTTAVDATISIVSLAEAKEYLKVTTSNEDVIISHLINAVSGWVRRYLKRELVSTARVEYYSGDGELDLVLRNYPITTMTGVWIDGLRAFGSATEVTAANYIAKKKAGILTAFNLLGGWSPGESNIKVSYTAGYTVATDGGNTGTMPYEIRMAAKRMLDKQYRQGYTNRKLDNSSESISGMNVTFTDDAIPKDVKTMLDGFRRSIPAHQFEYAD